MQRYSMAALRAAFVALPATLLGVSGFVTPSVLSQIITPPSSPSRVSPPSGTITPPSSSPELVKPSNPEATGLVINLLARYAANVTDKTDLDRAVEESLNDTPENHKIAQEIVTKFNARPLVQRQER